MRSCLKIPLSLFVMGLGFGRADEAAKAPVPAEPPAAPKPGKSAERLDLPVPKGQPQKGLRIPIFSPGGKLMMNFQIGVATWVDDDNIKMGELRVETFKDDGASEFDIDLPDSLFNIRTKELISKAPVSIKRQDFQISSNSMTFNTETKVGKFGDGVKMVIFDARAVAEKGASSARPAVEPKAGKEESK